jgi:hypothetical protein
MVMRSMKCIGGVVRTGHGRVWQVLVIWNREEAVKELTHV